MVEKMSEIANRLEEYNNLQECIIEDFSLYDFGTSISISFNYIWANKKEIRKNLDEKHIVTIKFLLINEFLIENNLPQALIDTPSLINWGLNEISRITILGISRDNFFTAEIVWETKRKVIIEFKDMIIE